MTGIDERDLCRQFGSFDFLIPTRQICSLQEKFEDWIRANTPGIILWGEPRIGKSSALQYLRNDLKRSYGKELPVYIYTCTANASVTQKSFYESVLLMLAGSGPAHGVNDDIVLASKGTANQMRQRIINRLTRDAISTKYQIVVMFIDEASLLTEKHYTWLIDISNALAINMVQLTVVLCSVPDILQEKRGYIHAGKQQIVQRFMLKEFEFHGIENLPDLMACMSALDNQYVPKGHTEPVCLSECYFPDAYCDGKTLASYATDFWNALQKLRKANNINGSTILTMKCFMDTVSYCLRKFGADAGENKVYAPTAAEWEYSLVESSYVSSQV